MSGRHAAPKRRKREYEDDDFAKAVGRMVRALERRASVNPDALAYLLTVQKEVNDAVAAAGHALTVQGGGQFSLGQIAGFLTDNGHRMSRQAAQQRWGRTPVATRDLRRVLHEVNAMVKWDEWKGTDTHVAEPEPVAEEATV